MYATVVNVIGSVSVNDTQYFKLVHAYYDVTVALTSKITWNPVVMYYESYSGTGSCQTKNNGS